MSRNNNRRQVKHLRSKSINVFNGSKSLDLITYTESPLEADFCYHLEYDDDVIHYQAQPLSIDYYFQNAVHSYTPDFEVFYRDGTICYFEVKYTSDIERIADFESWESAIRKASASEGKGFTVIKEDFIRQAFIYENLQTLYSSSNIAIDSDFLLHIIKVLDVNDEIAIVELMENSSSDVEFEQIYRLIFNKVLVANLSSSFLSKKTVVKYSGKGYEQYL